MGYNTMTNVTKDQEFNQRASMAFGGCMMTPQDEAKIDLDLGIPEIVIQAFLDHIKNPEKSIIPLDDQENQDQDQENSIAGPTPEDLEEEEKLRVSA